MFAPGCASKAGRVSRCGARRSLAVLLEKNINDNSNVDGERELTDALDLNVNLAIWRLFMNTTLRAAVHLGKDYEVKFKNVKNHLWKTALKLFRETEKPFKGQRATTGISLINFQILRWVSTSLLHSTSLSIFHGQPSSSPTLYSVWERWETILLNPGRGKSNGIRTTIISKN